MAQPAVVSLLREFLEPIGAVRARAMFGGHGIYLDGVMMALVAYDELWFKVDDATWPEFAAVGSEKFRPWPEKDIAEGRKPMEMSYARAPAFVYDEAEEMIRWARLALDAGLRAQKKKPQTKKKSQTKKSSKKKPARKPEAEP